MPGQVSRATRAGDDHLAARGRRPAGRKPPYPAACGAPRRPAPRAGRRTRPARRQPQLIVDQSESLPMITPTTGSDGFGAAVTAARPVHQVVAQPHRARPRTSSRSVPKAVTWPTLRPGRNSLPYRWILTSGQRGQTVMHPLVDARRSDVVRSAEHVRHDHHGRGHRGRAERVVQHRAQVLLELRGARALDRPVGRVVRTHRQLVDQQRAVAVSNSSTASTPVTPSSDAMRSASRWASSASSSARPGAGAMTSTQMPSCCTVSTTGQAAPWPNGDDRATLRRDALLGDQRRSVATARRLGRCPPDALPS